MTSAVRIDNIALLMLDNYADDMSLAQLLETDKPLIRTLPISQLTRLIGRLHETTGQAEVELCFSQSVLGLKRVQGNITATVQAICQRCLEPFACKIVCPVNLAFVATEEEANDLPEEYEPVFCTDGEFSLQQLIEDELILALPIVFRHDDDSCDSRVQRPVEQSGEEIVPAQSESTDRRRSLAGLGALMSHRKN